MGTADDKLSIIELCVRYGEFLDAKHVDRLGTEIFTDDACIDYGSGEIVGTAAIDAYFRPFVDAMEGAAHNMSNFLIEVDGDVARGTSRATAWHWMAELSSLGRTRPADITGISAFADEFRRTDAGWRIARRTVRGLGPGGVAIGRPPEALLPLLEGLSR